MVLTLPSEQGAGHGDRDEEEPLPQVWNEGPRRLPRPMPPFHRR